MFHVLNPLMLSQSVGGVLRLDRTATCNDQVDSESGVAYDRSPRSNKVIT
jgi:hypothetical protein